MAGYTLTQREFSTLKSRLTRAKNTGDKAKVLAEVRHAVSVFNEKGWPDNWATWRIAAEDVCDFFDPELHAVQDLFY